MADMAAYSSVWSPTVQTVLKSVNLTVHSAPPPGSGAVLGAILNIMDQFPDHQVQGSRENLNTLSHLKNRHTSFL